MNTKFTVYLSEEVEKFNDFSQAVEKIYKWLQERTTYIRISPKFKHPAGALSWYIDSVYPYADEIRIDSKEILEHVLGEPIKYGSEGIAILIPSYKTVGFIEIEKE